MIISTLRKLKLFLFVVLLTDALRFAVMEERDVELPCQAAAVCETFVSS